MTVLAAAPTTMPPVPEPDIAWQAVSERDVRYNGQFVYAVASTGIYCRPSCPSRRPRRDQVAFFSGPAAAEAAGYRACRRCHPRDGATAATRAVERARAFLEEHLDEPVTLARLADAVGMSPFHLQRSFKRALGLTPREYAAGRRADRLRATLREEPSVSRAVYAAGYGSSSRVYERAGDRLGMTPATYRRGGRGARVAFATAASPLGRLLVAGTERGVCFVALGADDAEVEAALRRELPEAEITRGGAAVDEWLAAVVAHVEGERSPLDLPLDVRATAFQLRVWRALRTIPPGQTRSYSEVARALGLPTGARAVARACASNPVAVIIPCHRVVGSDGALTGYAWGVERKRKLLEREKRER